MFNNSMSLYWLVLHFVGSLKNHPIAVIVSSRLCYSNSAYVSCSQVEFLHPSVASLKDVLSVACGSSDNTTQSVSDSDIIPFCSIFNVPNRELTTLGGRLLLRRESVRPCKVTNATLPTPTPPLFPLKLLIVLSIQQTHLRGKFMISTLGNLTRPPARLHYKVGIWSKPPLK